MTTLRRFSTVALAVACAHIIFGAIVRISGSGMGCGDNWPKCYGRWFPPFDQPTLVIEWTHRLLASTLILTIVALVGLAWSRRHEPGVGGPGGVLRTAAGALGLVVLTAIFGAITVFLGNTPLATVGHWVLAATLLATVGATVIRAGGLGGTTARAVTTSAKTARSAVVALVLALLVVAMGGLTAKIPGASSSCPGFPLCGGAPMIPATHVQLTHRLLAVLFGLHVLGMAVAMRKRGEPALLRRAVYIVLGLVVAQIVLAATMVLSYLPAPLRSLHQATGVAIWLSTFTLAYLARIAAGRSALARVPVPAGRTTAATPEGRVIGMQPRGVA